MRHYAHKNWGNEHGGCFAAHRNQVLKNWVLSLRFQVQVRRNSAAGHDMHAETVSIGAFYIISLSRITVMSRLSEGLHRLGSCCASLAEDAAKV
jgi:hypothetical protein